jgi:hypothetical protein
MAYSGEPPMRVGRIDAITPPLPTEAPQAIRASVND